MQYASKDVCERLSFTILLRNPFKILQLLFYTNVN